MDELHNDNQLKNTSNENRDLLLTEHEGAANGNGHVASSHLSTALELPQLTTAPKVALKSRPTTEIDIFAIRRTRLNRLLMRKRRLGRDEQDIVPRLMFAIAILLIVFIS